MFPIIATPLLSSPQQVGISKHDYVCTNVKHQGTSTALSPQKRRRVSQIEEDNTLSRHAAAAGERKQVSFATTITIQEFCHEQSPTSISSHTAILAHYPIDGHNDHTYEKESSDPLLPVSSSWMVRSPSQSSSFSFGATSTLSLVMTDNMEQERISSCCTSPSWSSVEDTLLETRPEASATATTKPRSAAERRALFASSIKSLSSSQKSGLLSLY